MDAVKFLKERDRMTKCCAIDCKKCPLNSPSESKDLSCSEFREKYPEEYVEIVENWSKEHPKKTRQSELLKMFPNIAMDDDGVLRLNPCDFGLTKSLSMECDSLTCKECRKKFWLEEI